MCTVDYQESYVHLKSTCSLGKRHALLDKNHRVIRSGFVVGPVR